MRQLSTSGRRAPLTLLLTALLLAASWSLLLATSGPQQPHSDDGGSADAANVDDDEEAAASPPKLTIDPAAVRDAIADLLRDGAAAEDDSDDGYAEAAQEYLEHVQSLLGAVKSPSEVYIREQLADLETLDSVLAGLEADAGGSQLTPSAGARLVGHLVKGPARELLLGIPGGLEPATTSFAFPAAYAGSELAARLADAATELRRFLDSVTPSLAEDLRRHSDGLAAGRTRDFLDSVLDRVLELEGKKVRFNVEFPDAAGDGDVPDGGGLGEPRVSRAPDDDGDNDGQSASTSSRADDGGRGLFDQVLGRRAAASVAARLAEGGRTAAAARIGELRRRRYQPAGMEVILEAIEQCLKLDN